MDHSESPGESRDPDALDADEEVLEEDNKPVAMETSAEAISLGPRRHRYSNASLQSETESVVVPRKINRRRISREKPRKKDAVRVTLPNPVQGTFLTAPRDQEDMYASGDGDSGFATAREEGSMIAAREDRGLLGETSILGDTSSMMSFNASTYKDNMTTYSENVTCAAGSDYSRALDNLRERIKELQTDIEKCKLDFYRSEKPKEGDFVKYLKLCNDNLNFCSDVLKKNRMEPRKIDSEIRIVALLNDLRLTEDNDVDPEILGFITDFWENVKTTSECAVGLNSRFAGDIYKKLKKSCRSGSFQGVDLDITNLYTKDIVKYMNNLETTMSSVSALAKSFQNGLNEDLFSDSGFSLKVPSSVDSVKFPVLRLVPDLTEKLEFICKTALDWLDRDEAYVHEIQMHLSETRTLRREREEQIRLGAIQQRKITKSMKLAYLVCQNNKKKLQRLEKELEKLHRQVQEFSSVKKAKGGEKYAKESMLDFLKISISQTKKNYSLQMRKSRLLKQLKDLEDSLIEIETQMASLQALITEKTQQRQEMASKLEENGSIYTEMRKELEEFTENLQHLHQNLQQLQNTMSHLELLRNLKTSPEKIDDFYDRPSSVKLAPSLKEKIRRKRRIQAGTIVVTSPKIMVPRLITEEANADRETKKH